MIIKYRTNVVGLVVTDPAQPHTLNLATTIAGVNNELICDPSLLSVLTNAPYSLPVLHDFCGVNSLTNTKYTGIFIRTIGRSAHIASSRAWTQTFTEFCANISWRQDAQRCGSIGPH